MAIPEVGFEETPIKPTIREETVTKVNAKITIAIALAKRIRTVVW